MQLQTQLNFEKLTKYYCFQEVYRKKYEKKISKNYFLWVVWFQESTVTSFCR